MNTTILETNEYNKGTLTLEEKKQINLFIIWWFSSSIIALLAAFIDVSDLTIPRYILLLCLSSFSLFISRYKIKKSVIWFILVYQIITFLNMILVPYKSYVLIDAESSFIIFLLPILVFSSIRIDTIPQLIYRWYHASLLFFWLTPLFVILNQQERIHYGEIATVYVCEIVILLIGSIVYEWKKCLGTLELIIELIVGIIYGSRAPIIAGIIVIAFVICWKNRRNIRLFFFLLIVTIGILFAFTNLSLILEALNKFLNETGISSRNISKFLNEIGKLSLLDMMESSSREMLWQISIDFIKNKCGLPGGFAVVRYLTDGKYYFPHNLFLDLFTYLGVFSIPLVIYVFYKLKLILEEMDSNLKIVIIIIGVFFLFCSMTGAMFLSNIYAVTFWAWCLFVQKNKQDVIDIEKMVE